MFPSHHGSCQGGRERCLHFCHLSPWREAGHSLDRPPVYHRANTKTNDTIIHVRTNSSGQFGIITYLSVHISGVWEEACGEKPTQAQTKAASTSPH